MEHEEVYGIDQERAHPRAIELIPDEFFWDSTDEFAPFGADEGDIALAEYRDWRRDNPDAPAVECIEWTIESVGDMDAADYNNSLVDRYLIRRQMRDEQFNDYRFIFTLDISVIATGFGQLVDEGKIDPECKPYIQTAINRQRIWGEMSISEEYRDEYVDRMDVLEKVLKEA